MPPQQSTSDLLVHRIFQTFIDRLAESADAERLREGMAETAAALDLSCFAYLAVPDQSNLGCGDSQPPIPTFADGSHLR
jgi:hypothetical protein